MMVILIWNHTMIFIHAMKSFYVYQMSFVNHKIETIAWKKHQLKKVLILFCERCELGEAHARASLLHASLA